MTNNILDLYYNSIVHFRSAEKYLKDIYLINDVLLNNYTYEYATDVVDHIIRRYEKEISTIGKMLTGVMIFDEGEVEQKSYEDTINDLLYLRDCVIVIAAVATGVEDSLHSAIVRINQSVAQVG